jgi:DNA invertase Pin-like site-specific DNA recombinase
MTPSGTFVAYYRVSTKRQGASGLGLEAQKSAVQRYLDGGKWSLLAEFTEIESGKNDKNRPELLEALRECRMTGAKLIVSRLDRLSRDLEFIAHLQKSSVKSVVADMPDASHLTVQLLAALARHEREMISTRTREALAASKKKRRKPSARTIASFTAASEKGWRRSVAVRQQKADEYVQLAPDLQRWVAQGLPQAKIARALNQRRIRTPRGKVGTWTQGRVSRLLARLAQAKNGARE